MMQSVIRIKMDNAAFDIPNGNEVARILRDLADRCDGNQLEPDAILLFDINGNKVGVMLIGA